MTNFHHHYQHQDRISRIRLDEVGAGCSQNRMIWRSQSPISSQHQLFVAAERSSCRDTEDNEKDEKDEDEEDCSVCWIGQRRTRVG